MSHSALRTLREKARMRQSDLAAAAGLSLRTVVAIERGQYSPRMSTRQKLLDVFKLPHKQHFEVFGPMPAYVKRGEPE